LRLVVSGTDLLERLPVAVYTTDAEGRITFYNEAAAELWGHRPELGASKWCGSWRLYWPDGRPMPHSECPMAVTLRENRAVRGAEAVAERPDGRRVIFQPYPTPLTDESGNVIGAINLLVDVTERRQAEIDAARLAAIVASSDDAIVSKTLDGVVTSWNGGATRIFGYEPEEMIGQPIIRIIPPELLAEEEDILARIRRGERVDHFDTVRVRKDGRRISVSLTISPILAPGGAVIGASKVARDITERRQSEELQALLVRELNHRVKNTLATIQAIARQSLRAAPDPAAFVASFTGRIQALSRAHDLLVQGRMRGAELADLVREQVDLGSGDPRIAWSGPAVTLDSRVAVQMALVLHELATNARKYGALAVPTGRLAIRWTTVASKQRELRLEWTESGVPSVAVPSSAGFGTTLIERSLEANRGETVMRYRSDGLTCELRLSLPDEPDELAVPPPGAAPVDRASPAEGPEVALAGKRVLIVEDEPLIALDIQERLGAAGCAVVGPAASIDAARRLLAEGPVDAALLDVNLSGERADGLAAELTRQGIPFAFATGYGRECLPEAFPQAPVLAKPFEPDQPLATLRSLLAGSERPEVVVPWRGSPRRPGAGQA
jgi:PAS domain S-box-containing protein